MNILHKIQKPKYGAKKFTVGSLLMSKLPRSHRLNKMSRDLLHVLIFSMVLGFLYQNVIFFACIKCINVFKYIGGQILLNKFYGFNHF